MNKAYPKYKTSGVEWLGDVPEHWLPKSIKYIAAVKGRIGFRGYTTDDLVDEGEGALVLGGANLSKNGKIDLNKRTYLSWEKYHESPEIKVIIGDVIFGQRGTCGFPVLIDQMFEPTTINPSLVIIRQKGQESRFLSYWLMSDFITSTIKNYISSTAVPMLSQEQIGNFPIPLPPLPEQQAIAAFLDRETGRIDALIAKKERLLELLAEQRTALISRAVTKGLDASVKLKPSGVEWLGDVPEHWGNIALKWASVRYSGGTPDKSIQEYWEDGTIPWLNSGAVNDDYITEPSAYITKEAFQNSSAKWIPKDALVMALAGQGKTKGMVGQLGFRTTCNQSMAAIVPNEKLNSRMLYWWLTKNYINIRNLAGGEARDGLNLDLLGSIPVPLPPLPEQKAIAVFLDRETAKIDALSAKVTTVIERLKEYRTALISSAVTGKIDVREAV